MNNLDEALYEEHKNLICRTIWRNRPLLAALRLENDDVAQQLSITMLSAIKKFDPNKSASLRVHIKHSLQYEILNMKRRHKPHGITGVPNGCRLNFHSFDNRGEYTGSVLFCVTQDKTNN